MLMLTAFMDETGESTDEQQMFVGMAGLIAPEENWRHFERRWMQTLRENKVPCIKQNKNPYFHMKEFAHSVGTFKGWKDKPVERENLRRELIATIQDTGAIPFGTIIPMEQYRALPEHWRKWLVDPYYLSFQFCSGFAVATMQKFAPTETCLMVFSEQNKFRGKATRFYNMIKRQTPFGEWMDEPLFRDMRKIVPLQAADVVAYELNKEYDRRLYHPNEKPRSGWKDLSAITMRLTGKPHHFFFHTKVSLSLYGQNVDRVLAEVEREKDE